MKNLFFLFLAIISCSITGIAQTVFSGFDTPADQNQWTIYRLGSLASSNWNFVSSSSVSAPYSVNHDYPMNGAVEDWLVSPKIYFTGTSSKITLYANRFAFSNPPDVYYGVWISFFSKNPNSGNYSEVVNLTTFPTIQSSWHDTTVNISLDLTDSDIPIYADSGYIAIKYKAIDYAWLMLGIDNITIDSASTTFVAGIDKINKTDVFRVFPNPAKDKVEIQKTNYNNTFVELLNMEGQVLQTYNLDAEKKDIDIKDLQRGIYILRVTDKNGSSSKKLLKL